MAGDIARNRSLSPDGREIKIVTFDLDGTLYDQRRLRIMMGMEMAKELLWTRAGRRSLRIISNFRRTREKLAEQEQTDIVNRQYLAVSTEMGVTTDEVRAVTNEWLLQRPLPFLSSCKEPGIDQLFERLRDSGIIVAVLSDYPAHDKLQALGLHADIVVSATDEEVSRFKPHPEGLLRVLSLANQDTGHCLVIGDRHDRDGACAQRAGAAFLLKTRRGASSAHRIRNFHDLLK